MDLHLPDPPPPAMPLVVFLHGGGFTAGERGAYAFLGRVLAARGVAVAIPDYRLWPETAWPGFVEDAALAVAWLRAAPARAAGAPAAPPRLMGHSAGGFLAGALALDPRWLGEAGRAGLAGCVTLAAPFDFVPQDQPLATIFAAAPDGAIRAAAADPAALAAAPPMLLLHGEADRTVRPVQAIRMAERLAAAGARCATLRLFPGVGHIGILAAMAAPVRALGLAGAPVLEAVSAFLHRPGCGAGALAAGAGPDRERMAC
jgi:acetyl esterase/lipase